MRRSFLRVRQVKSTWFLRLCEMGVEQTGFLLLTFELHSNLSIFLLLQNSFINQIFSVSTVFSNDFPILNGLSTFEVSLCSGQMFWKAAVFHSSHMTHPPQLTSYRWLLTKLASSYNLCVGLLIDLYLVFLL